jgi:hypothetical protein
VTLSQCGQWWLQGIYVTFNEVGGIVECQNIDNGPQLL